MQRDGILFRNEAKMQIPNCPYCHSGDVIKYGTQKNKTQRFQCNTCRKIFNHRYGTLLYKKRLCDDEILRVVYLFLT
ncbi:MAG: hypothetical protein QHH15_03455, partial [Candidatus Thermoplasmatota archaeon]|nr:hypothetical protein [Candidatus Thermoplasmatota archaeon]